MTQEEFDVKAAELLGRAKAKLATEGVTTGEIGKGFIDAGGITVKAVWKTRAYNQVVALKVGHSYRRQHEHVFGQRGNGKDINWDGFVTEVQRQIGARVAQAQTQKLAAERYAESKRLSDEVIARHGLRPAEVEYDGAFLLRHGQRFNWDSKLSVKTLSHGETRTYDLTLELNLLTPEQLDRVLTVLKPVVEEYSLNQPEVIVPPVTEVVA